MVRELNLALRACVATFIVCAVAYPAAVWGFAQLLFPAQAEGSLVYSQDRTVIGSELIAQKFESDRYFHPRPSAADYKADAASGSNLGTKNPDLRKAVQERAEKLKATSEHPAPVDLVTASGSGLDPDISVEAAEYQAPRVAAARGWTVERVRAVDRTHDQPLRRNPRRPAARQRPALEPRTRRGERPRAIMRVEDQSMPATELHRPTPEQFLNLIRRQTRGRLKVYLGSAAGVGKTYAMLREGHRLKAQGVDVVIGLVETHGRAETQQQIGDLEVIPPRIIEYRGVTLREMDLDAILARRPMVCLVDELAHTNAPGSQHPKRYQDVEDLLHAGIHVITTVNVQHLESLYDEIERATNVRVKERLPDRVVAEADQIVNVDVSVEDLIERLSTGKIYPEDRISPALENFFRPSNLTRLREITMTEIAHLIDRRNRRAEADRYPLSATDRVMVGLSSRSPDAPALLRKTARLADRINAPWYAVYIQIPAEDITRIDALTQRLISNHLELAQQLGGIPMTFRGSDVASTILAFAREYAIKIIVVGKTRQPWYKRLWGRSILERLERHSEGIDIVIADV